MSDEIILDDNLEKTPIPPAAMRWKVYLLHTCLILSLHLVVLFFYTFVLPFLPKSIEITISEGLLACLIFGIYGITLYAFIKGLKWNLIAAIIGGSFVFFFCFIYIMNNIDNIEKQGEPFLEIFSLGQEGSVILVGICYSIMIVPFTEALVTIGLLCNYIYSKITS